MRPTIFGHILDPGSAADGYRSDTRAIITIAMAPLWDGPYKSPKLK